MKTALISIMVTAAAAITATATAAPPAAVYDSETLFAGIPDCRLEVDLGQVKEIHPREAHQSAQGLAIHNGTVFALYHLGDCVVYDLDNNRFINEFMLDGAEGTHCNNASFGVERADSTSAFPLLYVSECSGERRCFVLDIDTCGSRCVQTLTFEGEGIDSFCDWCVDRENRFIYAIGKTPESGVVLKRFALPAAGDGKKVVLGNKDVLWERSYPKGFFHIMQGTYIDNGVLYAPTGDPRKGSCRIHLIDLATGRRTALYDIDAIGREPEGVCAANGRLWVFFTGGGGCLYSFDIL